MKKIVIVLLIIIVILAIILGIKILNKDNNNYNYISSEELKIILLSALDNNNYTYTIIEDGERRVKKVKDNIIVTKSDNIISWANNDTKEVIAIDEDKKIAVITYEKTDKTLIRKDFLDIETLINDYYKDNLFYIKNEKFKGKECIVIDVGEDKSERYWIDKESGFIIKYVSNTGGDEILFEIELNNVKDSDIERPSLEKYEVKTN